MLAAPSPSPLPASSSRLHPVTCSHIEALSEEILLEILSHLSINQLLATSRVSRRFNRLCDEPRLWRKIYYSLFTIERLKHPFLPARDQRLRGSLESRSASCPVDRKGKKKQASEIDEQTHLGHTWKTLCRVSLNWKTGSAGLTRITPTNPSTTASTNPSTLTTNVSCRPQDAHHPRPNTIVRFYRSLLFIARRSKSSTESPPVICVYRLGDHSTLKQTNGSSVLLAKLSPSVDPQDSNSSILGQGVTEISIDDTCDRLGSKGTIDSTILLSAFYTSGQFTIFRIQLPSDSSSNIDPFPFEFQEVGSFSQTSLDSTLSSSSSSGPGSPKIHHELVETAKFQFPLIVTCSTDFHLRFFRLSWLSTRSGNDQLQIIKLSLDMKNHSGYWPLSLSLKRCESSSERFKMSIAYPMPFYPSTWTIGLQEFEFELTNSRSASFSLKMYTNRFLTAFQTPQDKSRRMMAGLGLGEIVIGIEQAAENVIVGRSDNTIDCFRLVSPSDVTSLPSSSSSNLEPVKGLIRWKTLFGHTSRIGSISIDDSGRCVSGGMDGVKVWEGTESVDVHVGSRSHKECTTTTTIDTHNHNGITNEATRSVGWIGLDSEKIVSLWFWEDNVDSTTDKADGDNSDIKTKLFHEEVRVLSFI